MKLILNMAVMALNLAVYAALIRGPALQASVIAVNWGGNYVSTVQNLEGDTGIHSSSDQYGDPFSTTGVDIINGAGNAYDNDALFDDSVMGRLYSSSTAFNPTSGYDMGATSARFYGGATTFSKNGAHVDGFTELSILNQGSNDSIHLHTDSGTDDHTMHAFLFWDKTDFLNGSDSAGSLAFDQDSMFSLSTSQVSNGSAGSQDLILRWAVRDGDNWYLSSATNILSPNDTLTDNLYGRDWATFDPTASYLNFDQDSAAFGVQSSTFTDITAVGFYIDHDLATGQPHIHIENFSAAVVPEPGSAVLLLLGLGRMASRRRRVSAGCRTC